MAPKKSIADRFWSRVDKSGECWEWTGSRSTRGYGTLSVCGTPKRATHVSVFLATGQWPPAGMMVCHKCDNPPCVNPAHLFVGTPLDNVMDAMNKNRHKFSHIPDECKPRGEAHGSAKLTAEDVLEIRRTTGVSQRVLAARYGITQKTLLYVLQGKTWRHLLEGQNV